MNQTMTPIDWAKRPVFEKYADFTGRAPRAEYWWYVLAVIIVAVVVTIVESILGLGLMFMGMYGPLTLLLGLALFLPNLGVAVRRLHDTDRSGWWVLLWLVPWAFSALVPGAGQSVVTAGVLALILLACCLLLIVFMVLPSTPGENRYGSNPYGEGMGAVAAE